MIIRNDGRIAYHAIILKENGGSDFIQYDFDGKELYRHTYSRPSVLTGVFTS